MTSSRPRGILPLMSELPEEAMSDCFRPPDIPVEVHCLHCHREYDSYLIWWDEEELGGEPRGFWRCPTPGCSGAGFGFDIWPIDPDYIDPQTGEKMWDECEDDEAEWDEDEAVDPATAEAIAHDLEIINEMLDGNLTDEPLPWDEIEDEAAFDAWLDERERRRREWPQ
jgi:hypothetical protein